MGTMIVEEKYKIPHALVGHHRPTDKLPLAYVKLNEDGTEKPLCKIYAWKVDNDFIRDYEASVLLDGYATREDLAAVISHLILQRMGENTRFHDAMLGIKKNEQSGIIFGAL